MIVTVDVFDCLLDIFIALMIIDLLINSLALGFKVSASKVKISGNLFFN